MMRMGGPWGGLGEGEAEWPSQALPPSDLVPPGAHGQLLPEVLQPGSTSPVLRSTRHGVPSMGHSIRTGILSSGKHPDEFRSLDQIVRIDREQYAADKAATGRHVDSLETELLESRSARAELVRAAEQLRKDKQVLERQLLEATEEYERAQAGMRSRRVDDDEAFEGALSTAVTNFLEEQRKWAIERRSMEQAIQVLESECFEATTALERKNELASETEQQLASTVAQLQEALRERETQIKQLQGHQTELGEQLANASLLVAEGEKEKLEAQGHTKSANAQAESSRREFERVQGLLSQAQSDLEAARSGNTEVAVLKAQLTAVSRELDAERAHSRQLLEAKEKEGAFYKASLAEQQGSATELQREVAAAHAAAEREKSGRERDAAAADSRWDEQIAGLQNALEQALSVSHAAASGATVSEAAHQGGKMFERGAENCLLAAQRQAADAELRELRASLEARHEKELGAALTAAASAAAVVHKEAIMAAERKLRADHSVELKTLKNEVETARRSVAAGVAQEVTFLCLFFLRDCANCA